MTRLQSALSWEAPGNDSTLPQSFKSLKLNAPSATPRLIAVGGGKGGVGKTVVSILIGICLSNMNKRTVIVDADFSGPNLHQCLNTFDSKITIQNLLSHGKKDINRYRLKTGFENLYIVSGSPGVLGSGNFAYWQKKKIISNLRKLKADYVILDLAAGMGYNELDMFLAADDRIVICQPEPMALQDAYAFIRASLLRKLQRTFNHWPEFINILNKSGNLDHGNSVKSLDSILEKVTDIDQTWRHLIESIIKSFQPKFILNMLQDSDDPKRLQALRLTLRNIYGITTKIWGTIRFDPGIRAALKQLRPDLLLTPSSLASEDIVRLVNRNIIARELLYSEEQDMNPNVSFQINDADDQKNYTRICNYRCVAWNCCEQRQGGMPCKKINDLQTVVAT